MHSAALRDALGTKVYDTFLSIPENKRPSLIFLQKLVRMEIKFSVDTTNGVIKIVHDDKLSELNMNELTPADVRMLDMSKASSASTDENTINDENVLTQVISMVTAQNDAICESTDGSCTSETIAPSSTEGSISPPSSQSTILDCPENQDTATSSASSTVSPDDTVIPEVPAKQKRAPRKKATIPAVPSRRSTRTIIKAARYANAEKSGAVAAIKLKQTDEERDIILRRSQRVNEMNTAMIEESPYAVLPDLQPLELGNARTRETCIYNGFARDQLSHAEIKRFTLATAEKLSSREDECFEFLSTVGHDIRKAMETVDEPDSLVRQKVEGPRGMGVWNSVELNTFGRIVSNNRIRDLFKRLAKDIPTKTKANLVNSYYILKKYRCDRNGYPFCKTKIDIESISLGYKFVKSRDCANCVGSLWKAANENVDPERDLCALCHLYFKSYQSMRPNAKVTPQVFNFDSEISCGCTIAMKYKRTPFNQQNYLQRLKKFTNKDVFFIDNMQLEFLQAKLMTMSVSDTVDMLLMDPDLNSDVTHIIVCRKGVLQMDGAQMFSNNNVEGSKNLETKVEHFLTLLEGDEAESRVDDIAECVAAIGSGIGTLYSFERLQAVLDSFGIKSDSEILLLFTEFSTPKPDGYPDVMYFGTVDAESNFSLIYDVALLEYSESVMINDTEKITVNPVNVPTPAHKRSYDEMLRSEESSVDMLSFLRAYHTAKRKLIETSKILGVSTDFCRAFLKKNRAELTAANISVGTLLRPKVQRKKNTKKQAAAAAAAAEAAAITPTEAAVEASAPIEQIPTAP